VSRCAEGFPTYVVDLSGRVVAATQPTLWRSDELLDTGRTFDEMFATPRKTADAVPLYG
jgi:hypothetical protein